MNPLIRAEALLSRLKTRAYDQIMDSEAYRLSSPSDRHPQAYPEPLAVLDGACALCSYGARLIDRFDRRERIRICPVQSPLGQRLLEENGLDAHDPESWLFIDQGRAYKGFEAWIRLGQACGGMGRAMTLFWALPRPLRARLYRWVAQNRIAWFGTADLCALPSPSLRARLVGLDPAEPVETP